MGQWRAIPRRDVHSFDGWRSVATRSSRSSRADASSANRPLGAADICRFIYLMAVPKVIKSPRLRVTAFACRGSFAAFAKPGSFSS